MIQTLIYSGAPQEWHIYADSNQTFRFTSKRELTTNISFSALLDRMECYSQIYTPSSTFWNFMVINKIVFGWGYICENDPFLV